MLWFNRESRPVFLLSLWQLSLTWTVEINWRAYFCEADFYVCVFSSACQLRSLWNCSVWIVPVTDCYSVLPQTFLLPSEEPFWNILKSVRFDTAYVRIPFFYFRYSLIYYFNAIHVSYTLLHFCDSFIDCFHVWLLACSKLCFNQYRHVCLSVRPSDSLFNIEEFHWNLRTHPILISVKIEK